MRTRWIHSLQTLAAAVACHAAVGCTADTTPPEIVSARAEALSRRGPVIPTELAVPAGHRLAFKLHAEGDQIYICGATASGGYAWTLKAPDADLFDKHGALAGLHYGGPTWEGLDGSTVVGARLAGVTVDATAIPWLLIKAVSNTGNGKMSKVTYIQRVETTAGLAPTTGCDVDHVAALVDIAYTTNYYFFEAAPACPQH